MGGIDKRVLATSHSAIDEELQRIKGVIKKGRYIPTLDHLVPDNVPWENYRHYARELKEIIGKI
jgi:uroporphyrinogen decarboxylase